MSAAGAWIEQLAWPDVARRIEAGTPILVPVGAAAKEHGPHLPMNTDWRVAQALTDRVLLQLNILAAPIVGIGYYPAFVEFAGSQSLNAATFQALLEEVLERFIDQGGRHLAILNTGVSTEAPVSLTLASIYRRRGVRCGAVHLRLLGSAVAHLWQQGGGHADERETSLMLAIDAGTVHLKRWQPTPAPVRPIGIFQRPTILSTDPARGDEFTPNGAAGDPSAATAEKGQAALEAIVAELIEGLRRLFPDAKR